jgi:peptide chain release factor 2
MVMADWFCAPPALNSSQEGFWENQEGARETMSKLGRLKGTLERAKGWQSKIDDVDTGLLLTEDEGIEPAEAQEILGEADQTLKALQADLDRWEVESLLSGPYDQVRPDALIPLL